MLKDIFHLWDKIRLVKVWRTSTPEPTRGDGIIWTYIKDVTRYTPLFAKPGTFILQLDNLIQTGLDGIYSSKLTSAPITSYGALDLPTYFIDLTPFVPVLVDGKPHKVTIDVVSAEEDHTILENWFVSGLLQVFTDGSMKPTTGRLLSYMAQSFASTTTSGSVGENGDINITVTAARQIHIEADIVSGSGQLTRAVWSQDLEYSNVQNYLKNATIQARYFTLQNI
ncbi:hypothetical protein H0H87_000017 [Tephrocybe sp. NHM501043]|nr:hypothetical protein H0H87_000017 [Tephrocybe sp. NHM501043]